MNIAWFTPTTGDGKTVVYSRWTLSAMAEICEPRLYCVGPPERFPPGIPVVDLGAHPQAMWESGSLDAAFYILGNDVKQHAWIFEIARLHPGIVVLHDLSLHGFFIDYYLRQLRRPDLYITRMAEHYGLAGVIAAHRILGPSFDPMSARVPDEDLLRYTFTEEALRSAIGAVVHTRSHGALVRALWGGPVYESRLQAADGVRSEDHDSALKYAQGVLRFAEQRSMHGDVDYFGHSASRAAAERIASQIGQTLGSLGALVDSPAVEEVIGETARLLSPPLGPVPPGSAGV